MRFFHFVMKRVRTNFAQHFILIIKIIFFLKKNFKMTKELIVTDLTKLLKIKHPVMLAGMNVAAGPELVKINILIFDFCLFFILVI